MPGVKLVVARFSVARSRLSLHRAIIDEAELLLLAVSPEFRRRASGNCCSTNSWKPRATRGEPIHLNSRGEIRQLSCIDPVFSVAGLRRKYYRVVLAANSTADLVRANKVSLIWSLASCYAALLNIAYPQPVRPM